MLFNVFGSAQLSLNVTWAPHLAAKIPGNAVPQPISRIFLFGRAFRRSHRNHASNGAQRQVNNE